MIVRNELEWMCKECVVYVLKLQSQEFFWSVNPNHKKNLSKDRQSVLLHNASTSLAKLLI